MSYRIRAMAVLVVAFVVVAACGVSFAEAAELAMEPCGPERSWGPAKSETPAGKPVLAVPAVAIAFVDLSEPAPRWAGLEGAAHATSRIVLVQPRAPRAPPLA